MQRHSPSTRPTTDRARFSRRCAFPRRSCRQLWTLCASWAASRTETQAGEEVTQQHADLVARLTNARETEQRLRQLLTERTGKMEDVLDVEEKISETRGEIESMEAEQNLLEHRVAFATVDLQLVEEYKEQLATGTTVSAGTQPAQCIHRGRAPCRRDDAWPDSLSRGIRPGASDLAGDSRRARRCSSGAGIAACEGNIRATASFLVPSFPRSLLYRFGCPPGFHAGLKSLDASHRTGSISD